MPLTGEPPFGVTENAEPGTACVGSRVSDQVTVTVWPSAPTAAEEMVGAVASTVKERVAVKPELAGVLSTFLARQ